MSTLVTNTKVAGPLLFGRLFRAPHDLTWWPSLAMNPEDLDRFQGAYLFSVCFFFLFKHMNAKLLHILAKCHHQNDRNRNS